MGVAASCCGAGRTGIPPKTSGEIKRKHRLPSAACRALTLLGCPMPARRDVLGFPAAAAGLNRSLSLIICLPAAPLTPAATCRSVCGRQNGSEQCRGMAVSGCARRLTHEAVACWLPERPCMLLHTGCLANRGLGGLEPGTANACCMFVCGSLHACRRGACWSGMLPAMRGYPLCGTSLGSN